jgi:hypothetical protein
MAAADPGENRRQLARRGIAVAGRGSERTLAAAAHGAIAFGFVGIGFLLSLVITGVIWLASWKSTYVREQSDRAGRYQIFVLLVNILAIGLWVLGLALLLWLTGWRLFGFGGGDPEIARSLPITLVIILDLLLLIVTIPIIVIWYFGTIIYGVYGAARALAGHDFHYPPPPWSRRKRLAPTPAADDEAPSDAPPSSEARNDEPAVPGEVLDRKLKWED